jgi:polyhydroxybutyrate depolymerase
MFRFSLLVMAIALAGNARADERDRAIAINGAARTYTLITPDEPTGAMPLLIVYHGGGQTAARARIYTRFDKWAARENFAVVYPQGLGNHWNDGRSATGLLERAASATNDIEFTSQIIGQLVAEGVADPARVFLTGASNGGMMAMFAGCTLSGRIAGIAPVVANQPVDWGCQASGLAALFIHGTEDEYMPYGGGRIAGSRSTRDLGSVLSADETITLFRQVNGCSGVKDSKRLDAVGGDKTVAVVTDHACSRAALKHIVIEGGGHTWPGARNGIIAGLVLGRSSDEVSATDEIWTFFKSLPPRR